LYHHHFPNSAKLDLLYNAVFKVGNSLAKYAAKVKALRTICEIKKQGSAQPFPTDKPLSVLAFFQRYFTHLI